MWSLSPDVLHLNHGSFGAVPIPVQDRQTEWRRRWEANPTAFVHNDLGPALATARRALAGFAGADEAGLAFVRNASQGVAAVLGSIAPTLVAGDEILTTDHDYNAVRQTLEHTAARVGATVRVVAVPFPVDKPDTVVDAVLGAVAERTRLVVIDHITSPTGLVIPIERIVSVLEPDVPVLVDGAHGPGQVDLGLNALGASWYTGNLHKWVCAPKGSGRTVRSLFREGRGINSSFAVFQDVTGKAKEKAIALGVAIGSGYLYETTFEKEVYSDLYGERGFDYGNIFTNPVDSDLPTEPGYLQRRLEIITEAAGMERERMLRWIVAWCGLSAAWILLDGAGVDHEAAQALDVARIAARQLEEMDFA